MGSGVRTFATLIVLVVLLLVFALLGWRWATRPFPARADASACVSRTVHAGDTLSPLDVTVSVLNASKREGLAGSTLAALETHHFAEGSQDNAPKGTSVTNVQVWAASTSDPAAKLVAGWLPGATVVKHTSTLPGITVVVGESFTKVKKTGPTSERITADGSVCSPVVD